MPAGLARRTACGLLSDASAHHARSGEDRGEQGVERVTNTDQHSREATVAGVHSDIPVAGAPLLRMNRLWLRTAA
jgi:hypothetical protein